MTGRLDEHRGDVGFIRDTTQLMRPPLTPEIQLHLVEETVPLWQKTKEQLGQMNVPPPFPGVCLGGRAGVGAIFTRQLAAGGG